MRDRPDPGTNSPQLYVVPFLVVPLLNVALGLGSLLLTMFCFPVKVSTAGVRLLSARVLPSSGYAVCVCVCLCPLVVINIITPSVVLAW